MNCDTYYRTTERKTSRTDRRIIDGMENIHIDVKISILAGMDEDSRMTNPVAFCGSRMGILDAVREITNECSVDFLQK